jgi:hypothetical protein
MRSEKKAENEMESYTVIEDWPWTFPAYEFTLETKFEEIESIEIDPSGRMADKNRFNNQWPLPDDAVFEVN